MVRIKQCKLRPSQKKFKSFLKMHNLSNYKNVKKSTFFYGLYRKDVEQMNKHKALLVLIWRGTDALLPGHLESVKKSKVNIKNVAISSFIQNDLDKIGIKYTTLPIVGRPINDIKTEPLGDEIYAYVPQTRKKFFNADLVDEIKKRCKYKINISTHVNHFSRQELFKIYKRCFCGLRFTAHDGLPNQVIEMGLMGRKCFHNGGIPGSIPWDDNIDNIIDSINAEAKNIGSVCNDLHYEIKSFIDIGTDWLNEEYWIDKP